MTMNLNDKKYNELIEIELDLSSEQANNLFVASEDMSETLALFLTCQLYRPVKDLPDKYKYSHDFLRRALALNAKIKLDGSSKFHLDFMSNNSKSPFWSYWHLTNKTKETDLYLIQQSDMFVTMVTQTDEIRDYILDNYTNMLKFLDKPSKEQAIRAYNISKSYFGYIYPKNTSHSMIMDYLNSDNEFNKVRAFCAKVTIYDELNVEEQSVFEMIIRHGDDLHLGDFSFDLFEIHS